MLQFKVLSGKMAGTEIVARHFPFQVGRLPQNDFVVDESGMFERHFTIELKPSKEFFLRTEPNAFIAVSGQQNIRETTLKNADVIEVGRTRLLVSLSPTRQHGLETRELLTWIALGLLTVGQIILIVWLMKG